MPGNASGPPQRRHPQCRRPASTRIPAIRPFPPSRDFAHPAPRESRAHEFAAQPRNDNNPYNPIEASATASRPKEGRQRAIRRSASNVSSIACCSVRIARVAVRCRFRTRLASLWQLARSRILRCSQRKVRRLVVQRGYTVGSSIPQTRIFRVGHHSHNSQFLDSLPSPSTRYWPTASRPLQVAARERLVYDYYRIT